MDNQTGFQLPGNDHPLWSAIKSLLAVAAGALGLAWRDRRSRKREQVSGAVKRSDEAWGQAEKIWQQYDDLLAKGSVREESLRRELGLREREIEAKDSILAQQIIEMSKQAATITIMEAQWDALVAEIQDRFDGYERLKLYRKQNGNGTKEQKQ